MRQLFRRIKPESIEDNPFRLIGSDWMLITAGTPESYNTMTASWGGLGKLWHDSVALCFVRPTRFTYRFMEQARTFTLSFFSSRYRKALEFCGAKSGRDVDKARVTGLTPVPVGPGGVSFAQARLVLVCRKLYYQDLDPKHFLAAAIHRNYPGKDYHRMYIGKITSCLVPKR
jgi:flavin reductase (DIM6/NTAB) family NADH-FMN oxidoreductase RutF